jgi:hypothetical protein
VSSILKPVTEASKATKEEAKELATQINFRVIIFSLYMALRGGGYGD